MSFLYVDLEKSVMEVIHVYAKKFSHVNLQTRACSYETRKLNSSVFLVDTDFFLKREHRVFFYGADVFAVAVKKTESAGYEIWQSFANTLYQ